ncbi:hypothetical protein BC828DRAFT_52403 [Blastocladiella britannica]|nr:hypothetical protein BC828DRAFT_52403 [Blastocladiella britannica]
MESQLLTTVQAWADNGVRLGKAAIEAATEEVKRIEAATAAVGPSANASESDDQWLNDDGTVRVRPATGRRALARAQRIRASVCIVTAQALQQTVAILDTSEILLARAPTARAPSDLSSRMVDCAARSSEATDLLATVERGDEVTAELPARTVREATRVKLELLDMAQMRAVRVAAIEHRRKKEHESLPFASLGLPTTQACHIVSNILWLVFWSI